MILLLLFLTFSPRVVADGAGQGRVPAGFSSSSGSLFFFGSSVGFSLVGFSLRHLLQLPWNEASRATANNNSNQQQQQRQQRRQQRNEKETTTTTKRRRSGFIIFHWLGISGHQVSPRRVGFNGIGRLRLMDGWREGLVCVCVSVCVCVVRVKIQGRGAERQQVSLAWTVRR